MADNFSKQTAANFLQDVWGKRELGLPLPEINWNKPARPEEILYLLKQYPFLQLMSSEPKFPPVIIPKFKYAPSGWIIQDYDAAMSSSRGKDLFGPGNFESLPIAIEGDEEGDSSGGQGTVINQAFNTAYAMILLAKEKGWPEVDIIDGTRLMQWAAWVAATDNDYKLNNFEPSEEEQEKYKRLQKLGKRENILTSVMRLGRRR